MTSRDGGKLCPACGRDIGVWPIMKMPWPNAGLACPSCREPLEYQPAGWRMLGLIAPYLPLLGAAAWPTFEQLGHSPLAIGVVLVEAFVLWLPFEFFIARQLRAHSRLARKTRRSP